MEQFILTIDSKKFGGVKDSVITAIISAVSKGVCEIFPGSEIKVERYKDAREYSVEQKLVHCKDDLEYQINKQLTDGWTVATIATVGNYHHYVIVFERHIFKRMTYSEVNKPKPMKAHKNMSVFQVYFASNAHKEAFIRCIQDNLHLGVSVVKERRDCLDVNARSTTSAFSIGFLLGEINAKMKLLSV